MMITAYHGTSYTAAKQILQEGFLPGSYFATTPDHAIKEGARKSSDQLVYLFTVTVPADEPRDPGELLELGELHLHNRVPPEQITHYRAVPRPLEALLA